jgi:hypothetical protein
MNANDALTLEELALKLGLAGVALGLSVMFAGWILSRHLQEVPFQHKAGRAGLVGGAVLTALFGVVTVMALLSN